MGTGIGENFSPEQETKTVGTEVSKGWALHAIVLNDWKNAGIQNPANNLSEDTFLDQKDFKKEQNHGEEARQGGNHMPWGSSAKYNKIWTKAKEDKRIRKSPSPDSQENNAML